MAAAHAEAAGSEGRQAGDADLLVALHHELRRRILRAMAGEDRIGPRRLARLLREPLSKVSYHVRVLLKHGAIELVDTEPVRGSVAHFYSSTVEEPWALEVLGLDAGGPAAAEGEEVFR